jgi:hypothetical protein
VTSANHDATSANHDVTFEGKWAKLAGQTRKMADFCQKRPFPMSGVWPPPSVSAFYFQNFSFSNPRPISGHLSKKSGQTRKNGTVDDVDCFFTE